VTDNRQPITDIFELAKAIHVHLVGVCGIGMAGLAFLLKAKGHKVTGCDSNPGRIKEWLVANGIKVSAGHSADHLAADVGCVIRSAAVPDNCSDIIAAHQAGLPVYFRGAVLPAMLANTRSVAVAGTHGKTTTASFIAQLLKHAGRDPSWCIGGEVDALGGVAGKGEGEVMVVEADESDGTLALYEPDLAVVTNVEFDHMEHFENKEAFKKCFHAFIAGTRGRCLFCVDDPVAASLCAETDGSLSYGFTPAAQLRAVDLSTTFDAVGFTVELADKDNLGTIELPVPGRHNALNALAAVGIALELGLDFEEIRSGLANVRLPRRRLELIAEADGITVISDYAHHPSEIAALVSTVRRRNPSRLLAVFQPHRYTRTFALKQDFPKAFRGTDLVVLTPVYPASEPLLKGGTTFDLYAHWRSSEKEAPVPLLANTLEQAWHYLHKKLRAGDLLLVVGAGDIEKIANWAGEEKYGSVGVSEYPPSPLSAHCFGGTSGSTKVPENLCSVLTFDEPLARKTTLGVGGKADMWAEITSVELLGRMLQWTTQHNLPLTIVGAGSNLLVSDLGVRGVVARLVGNEFNFVRQEQEEVIVGAATPLSRLLDCLQELGLAGLEFLQDIPGSVGGALSMNAGAHGHETAEYVSAIRCLNPDGSEVIVGPEDAGFGYRRCECLAGRVAVEVRFHLEKAAPGEISRRRSEIAEERRWMLGLRTAGSVFRNPAADESNRTAGMLLDQAGLKGTRIGGAFVSKEHANVFCADKNATASDMIALMATARSRVADRFGIELEPEIRILG
jgi:UDP-N-acetylmuramate--alanine ligase